MKNQNKMRERQWLSIPLILAFTVVVGILLMNVLDTPVYEQEQALELKSDMLKVNRTIETMNDRQAVFAVNHMEKRLKEAEKEIGNEDNVQVQRILGESTSVLLELHKNLKERKLKKSGYPSKRIIY